MDNGLAMAAGSFISVFLSNPAIGKLGAASAFRVFTLLAVLAGFCLIFF